MYLFFFKTQSAFMGRFLCWIALLSLAAPAVGEGSSLVAQISTVSAWPLFHASLGWGTLVS
jgi:hypothetical protein